MRVAAASIFLFVSTSMAQFTSSIQLNYTHDSNVFGNFAEVPDNYLGVNINLDNYIGWDYSSVDMSYDGALSSYNSYPEQDNWNHNLSLNYRIQLSRVADDMDSSEEAPAAAVNSLLVTIDSLETFMTFSGSFNRTVPHSGDFAAYQNYIASGLASLRYPIAKISVLRLIYGINYTGYDYITSLSNLENIGTALLSFMPARGVSIYLEGSYGNKKYYGVDTVSSAVQNLIKMHSNGRYKGKGKGSTQPPAASVRTYLLDSPSATQATYGAGVNFAKGGWRGAGSFLIRRDPSGSARYISAVAKFSNTLSEVYDDPYSYEGQEFNLLFGKDSLLACVDFSVGLKRAGKDYNRPAYDTSQTVIVAKQRRDEYSDISVALSRAFSSGGFPTGFTIGLNYDRIVNASNDEYYKFTDDVVTLSLSVNLF